MHPLAGVRSGSDEDRPRSSTSWLPIARGALAATLRPPIHARGERSFVYPIFYLDRWNLVQAASAAKQFHPAMIVMTRARKRVDLGKARDRFGQLPNLVHIDTLGDRASRSASRS